MKVENIIPAYELLQKKKDIESSIKLAKFKFRKAKEEERKDIINHRIIELHNRLDSVLEQIYNL